MHTGSKISSLLYKSVWTNNISCFAVVIMIKEHNKKEIEKLSNIIIQVNLKDLYRIFINKEQDAFCSQKTCRFSSRIDHMFAHKTPK